MRCNCDYETLIEYCCSNAEENYAFRDLMSAQKKRRREKVDCGPPEQQDTEKTSYLDTVYNEMNSLSLARFDWGKNASNEGMAKCLLWANLAFAASRIPDPLERVRFAVWELKNCSDHIASIMGIWSERDDLFFTYEDSDDAKYIVTTPLPRFLEDELFYFQCSRPEWEIIRLHNPLVELETEI